MFHGKMTCAAWRMTNVQRPMSNGGKEQWELREVRVIGPWTLVIPSFRRALGRGDGVPTAAGGSEEDVFQRRLDAGE